MLILGLNAYHGDSAACLVRDGQLVAAAEEERFRRVKHWAGLPTEAIQYCLREAGAKFSDLDHIAINRQPGVNNLRRIGFLLTHWPSPGLVLNRLRNVRKAASIEDTLRAAFPDALLRAQVHHVEHHLAHLASAFLVSPFAEAVCVSVDGFGDFASAAWGMGQGSRITIDGRVYFPHSLGIFYSAITQLIGFPWFGDEYKVMGLAPYGEPKYLAQMREVVRVQSDGTYRLGLKYFRHHTDNVSYTWNDCTPEVGTLYTPELEKLLCATRKKDESLTQLHKDIARSAQAMYEEAFFALLNALHRKYRCANLALSGGCAMNSVANGKVYLQTPFKRMYLPAAAGDAGGAIGSAFLVHHQLGSSRREEADSPACSCGHATEGDEMRKSEIANQNPRTSASGGASVPASRPSSPSGLSAPCSLPAPSPRFVMSHAYVGPQSSNAEIEALIRARGLLPLAPTGGEGQGEGATRSPLYRSGDSSPASPGGASVLASQPSATAVKLPPSEFQIANFAGDDEGLCHRTAQAISEGKVVGWFQGRMEWGPRALGNRSILGDPRRADMKEILNAKIKRRESFRPFAPSILREQVAEWFEQDDDVPFMMQVFQVRPEKRKLVPATTHADGSGRLQTVHQETNPLYWQLITEYWRLTSVPMVLNTSFNENEPVVCQPAEALDCFLRTKMDVLVLGHYFITRPL